jgi:VWFA-related protein
MQYRLAATLAALAVGAHVLVAQQEAPPVFRAQVDAIQFDVSVTDARGNPVTDLTIDEFEVLEDGKPQAVTAVSLVNIPIERTERALFSPTAIEPDTQTNQRPDGRLYVFALGEMCPAMGLRTRNFMRRFIEEHFAANDIGAVVWTGTGRSFDTQDFTSNRRLLLNAIDRFNAAKESPPTGPLATLMGRARMRALRDLLEFMARLQGRRKTLMYVTEQIDGVQDVLDYNGGVRSLEFEDLQRAMIAATRGNVSIYPIDPRGLLATGDDQLGGRLGGFDAGCSTSPPTLAEISEFRAMAEATGGVALVNSNSFDQTFERIVRENSSYYVLGFTSSNERRDGRYRRVQVRVTRPGLQVRSPHPRRLRRADGTDAPPIAQRHADARACGRRIARPADCQSGRADDGVRRAVQAHGSRDDGCDCAGDGYLAPRPRRQRRRVQWRDRNGDHRGQRGRQGLQG